MEKISVSDLSIGDWVCAEQLCGVHSEPRLTLPMKVVGLGESWVNLEIDLEQGDPFEFEPSEIRGVPITAEVLEKNGFWHNGNKWYTPELFTLERGLDYWDIVIACACGEYVCEVYTIKYVHQLQHALRLAGVGKEIVL